MHEKNSDDTGCMFSVALGTLLVTIYLITQLANAVTAEQITITVCDLRSVVTPRLLGGEDTDYFVIAHDETIYSIGADQVAQLLVGKSYVVAVTKDKHITAIVEKNVVVIDDCHLIQSKGN